MPFNIITIREAEDQGPDDLYPIVGDEHLIRLDPEELPAQRYTAKAIIAKEWTGRRMLSIGRVEDSHIEMYVTDCRMAVASEKFLKGGTWIGFGAGGIAVAMTATAVSKIRARVRRRGKMLVGQVRYPWLKQIGFRPRRALRNDGQVRFIIEDGTQAGRRTVVLDVGLTSNYDPREVATRILRRAVQYRLAHDVGTASSEVQAAFMALSDPPHLDDPLPGRFALYTLPTYLPVGSDTVLNSPAMAEKAAPIE